MLLKIKVSLEPCLLHVVVLMRGCSGTGEYETGKEKSTVYSLQKTRLHQWLQFDTLLSERGESTLVCVFV